jgi:hypothetical protein
MGRGRPCKPRSSFAPMEYFELLGARRFGTHRGMSVVHRIAVLVGCVFLLFQPVPAFSQQEIHSQDRVLALVREALSRYKSLDLQATCHIQFPTDKGLGRSSLFLKLRHSGSSALLSLKDIVDRPGQETPRMQVDFVVEDNGEVLALQTALDSSLKQVAYTQPNSELRICLHSQRVAGKQTVDRDSVYFMLNDAGAVVWVIGYAPVLDILDRATEIQVAPVGSGVEILASGEDGRLRLAVSPSSGWLPQSFELIKEPEHKTTGGRVANVYKNLVKSIVWTGEIKGFKTDSKGRCSPTEIRVHRQTNWKDRPAESIETTIELQKVSFDPTLAASDLQSDITAPDGFRVTIDGAPNLPYRWDGRAAVPGIPDLPRGLNDVAYENLKNPSGAKRTQRLMILVNVLVFISTFGAVLWRWRKRGASR